MLNTETPSLTTLKREASLAKLSDLAPTLARVLGLSEASVRLFARHAREGGLISQAGRGPGGADMTARDCANLLIAVMGGTYAKDAASTIRSFRSPIAGRERRRWQLPRLNLPALRQLPDHHGFAEALEVLIAAAAQGTLQAALNETIESTPAAGIHVLPTITVMLRGPIPVAEINISASQWGEGITYAEPNPWLKSDKPSDEEVKEWQREVEQRGRPGDLEQLRIVSTETILALGELLAK